MSSVGGRQGTFILPGLLVLGVLWLLLLGLPVQRRWTAQQRERASMAADALRAAQAAVRARAQVADSIESIRGQFLSLAPRLFAGGQRATLEAALAAFIEGGAEAAGLALGPVEATADSALTGPFIRIVAKGEGRGDLAGLRRFLSFLAQGPQMISLLEFSIEQPEPDGNAEIADALRIRLVVAGLGLTKGQLP